MDQPTPKLVTVDDARTQLGMSRDKIYELMSSGDLAYVSLPPHSSKQAGRRVEQAEIDAFIKRNRQPAVPQ